MNTVIFGSFTDLIFSALESGFLSVSSITLIVVCFWSRTISWALSLGIRGINTPCRWSIYKFDNSFRLKGGLLSKIMGPSFVRIVSMRTCFSDIWLRCDLQGYWTLDHKHLLFSWRRAKVNLFRMEWRCRINEVKINSIHSLRSLEMVWCGGEVGATIPAPLCSWLLKLKLNTHCW